jgi:hypothetical protein
MSHCASGGEEICFGIYDATRSTSFVEVYALAMPFASGFRSLVVAIAALSKKNTYK